MAQTYRTFALLWVLFGFLAVPVLAADVPSAPPPLPVRQLGKVDAPIVGDEYMSLTCPHCAAFYSETLPTIEKNYIDTGKVRFVPHFFVRDGLDMKAAALAYCMPEDQFFAFVSILFTNQTQWMSNDKPEAILAQYARLGGLPDDKAKACMDDKTMQDSLIASRTYVDEKLSIQSTPTFLINNGADKIEGAQSADVFSAKFDHLLAVKK